MTLTTSKKQEQRPNTKSGVIALVVFAIAVVAVQHAQSDFLEGSFAPCYLCAAAFVIFWALSGFAYSGKKTDLAEYLYASSLTFRAGVFWFGVVLPDAPDVVKSLGGFHLSEEQRWTIALVALVLSGFAVSSWIRVLKRETPDSPIVNAPGAQ